MSVESIKAQLDELAQEEWIEEMRWRGQHDLFFLVNDIIGVSPKYGVHQMGDPHVKECIDELNDYVQLWLAKRRIFLETGKVTQTKPMKAMYIMPRGTVKSHGVSGVLPVMAHLWDTEMASFISSGNHEKMAVGLGRISAGYMEGEGKGNILPDLYGPFKDPKGHRVWSQNEYTTIRRENMGRNVPTLKVFSVQTGGTSGHYKLGVLDDPAWQEMIEKMGDTWHEKCWAHYKSLGMILDPDSLFVFVTTRYGDGDLCGQIVTKEIEPVVRKRVFAGSPAGEVPDDFFRDEGWRKYAHMAGWKVIYENAWEGNIESENPDDYTLNFPVVWSQDRILEELNKDELFCMAQLQNRPAMRSDNPIQQCHIDSVWCKAEDVPESSFGNMVMTCDIAWKDQDAYLSQRGDDDVIQIWTLDDGDVYLVWGRFGKWTREEWSENFIKGLQFATPSRRNRMRRLRYMSYDKPIGGLGDVVSNYVSGEARLAGMRCPNILELNRGGTKKKSRLLAAAGNWTEYGRVNLVEGIPGAQELCQQMLKIGYSPHDDHADAAADVWNSEFYKPPKRRRDDARRDMDMARLEQLKPIAHGVIDPVTGSFSMDPRATRAKARVAKMIGG